MKRRQFIATIGAGAAAAAAAIAKPAIAQSSPELKWRLTSSFPKNLDTLWGGAETFCRAVSEATDGKFLITPFAAGEIVPGLQAADAVTAGTVEMCQTASYYYVGKDPTFALASAVPFGLNTRMQNAWLYQHGGSKLMDEFYAKFKFVAFPAGNTTCQMGGWFRKEIKDPADLNGLKMRIAGLAGTVMAKLGVVPLQLAGGEIYAALEKGAVDAAEWVGPYDDEKLGLQKVAPFYYYPGWWEGSTSIHNFINTDRWNSLPKSYQQVIRSASDTANITMTAKYDAENPGAIRSLSAKGAQLRAYPAPVLDACYKASNEVYAEISAKNPEFKKIYENMIAFRGEQYLWWSIAEYAYDTYMIRARTRT